LDICLDFRNPACHHSSPTIRRGLNSTSHRRHRLPLLFRFRGSSLDSMLLPAGTADFRLLFNECGADRKFRPRVARLRRRT
jgi:hypothetical protein